MLDAVRPRTRERLEPPDFYPLSDGLAVPMGAEPGRACLLSASFAGVRERRVWAPLGISCLSL